MPGSAPPGPGGPRVAWRGGSQRRRRPAMARAGPYLGCRACPRRARPQEAPAAAGRPRRALERPSAQRPSRPAWDLPLSVAPVAPALRTRPGPRGSGPGVRALPPGALRSVPVRTPTAVARARAGSRPPRAGLLFLVGAALPVGQTEPVNLAVEEGPVRGAPRKGSRGPAES